MEPVKIYEYEYTDKRGKTRKIRKNYKPRKSQISQDIINEIREKRRIGVPISRISREFGISR